MRLLLACVAVLLAPALSVLLTDRQFSGIEDGFRADAQAHVDRLKGVAAFYPPNVRKMADSQAILHLQTIVSDGELVATAVCGSGSSSYLRLFDSLADRCGQWTTRRRARIGAVLSVVFSAAVLAIMLMCRIKVQRAVRNETWSGDWTHWFVARGMPFLILAQVLVSMVSYSIVLQTVTGKMLYAIGILLVPALALYWIERRLVLAFVEPGVLGEFRKKRSTGTPRRRPDQKYVVR